MSDDTATDGSATLVASDLDRTLIYSANALRLGAPVTDPVCVEWYQDREQSFLTARALDGLVRLSERVAFVPVTTRTVRQYQRIGFPGVHLRYAVTSNGGVLLVDGEPCGDWAATVAGRLAEVTGYDEAGWLLAPLLERPWIREVRDADRYFRYLLLHDDVPVDWLGEVAAAADAIGWVSSHQGRKLYLIPRTLTKQDAVAEVVARVGADLVLAAGDSLLDRGLLEFADRAIRPAHGELADQGWQPAGVEVTRGTGGAAGEEIVAWFGVDYGVCLT